MFRQSAKPATPLLSLRWTLCAKRACVVSTDAEPDRLAPLPPPAPMGLRGVWVVAARCCADALQRSFACPSVNLRAPSRRGLHPDPFEGGRQWSARGASEFEAGAGAGTAVRT